jgi:L-alanine-DL-glutamate epimerase-like enolase superfamily enzyme
MRDRPMVLVRAQDHDGTVGWGEIWCNFPAVGAEHRARLVASAVAPLVVDAAFDDPAHCFTHLSARLAVLALQSGEPGPFAQVIAGVDIALWDLVARRRREPLWRVLGGAAPDVAVYVSGLNPDDPATLARERQREGHRAFKLKVGFDSVRDLANLDALRAALGDAATLMADANQAWSLDAAMRHAAAMQPYRLAWLEEPLRCDRPWGEWQRLREAAPMPLAAGENVAGDAAFDAALASRALGVVQPDIAKWGGFSGGVAVGRRIVAAGARFCPHWLGGGIGLLASAHLLATVGGDGLLEIDANPNPLRTLTCGTLACVVDGRARLPDAPGLGAVPDLTALARYAAD